jgi:uncharacterized membrane protein YphA (DoxX/SURF4 family)
MTPPCAWHSPLQRTFTSFPSGSVGAALLLLRVVVGVSAIVEAALTVANDQSLPCIAMAAPAALAGLTLLPGLLTPLAGAVLAMQGVALLLFTNADMLGLLNSGMALFEFVAMAAVVSVLGPGAMSVDSRLYGRREIPIG